MDDKYIQQILEENDLKINKQKKNLAELFHKEKCYSQKLGMNYKCHLDDYHLKVDNDLKNQKSNNEKLKNFIKNFNDNKQETIKDISEIKKENNFGNKETIDEEINSKFIKKFNDNNSESDIFAKESFLIADEEKEKGSTIKSKMKETQSKENSNKKCFSQSKNKLIKEEEYPKHPLSANNKMKNLQNFNKNEDKENTKNLKKNNIKSNKISFRNSKKNISKDKLNIRVGKKKKENKWEGVPIFLWKGGSIEDNAKSKF